MKLAANATLIPALWLLSTVSLWAQTNSLEFDGSNDYVITSKPTDLSGDIALSLSARVNLNNLSSGQTVVFLGDAASTNGAFSIFVDTDGSVSAQMAGSTFVKTGAGVITADQWYHLTITKSAGAIDTGVKIYVDGVEQTGLTASTSDVNNLQTGPIYLGRFGGAVTGNNLNGNLDEVVVWDRELTAIQVNELSDNGVTQDEPGIYAFYDIEACFGNSAADLSGNNFEGTLTNFDFSTGSDWAYTETLVNAAPNTQTSGISVTNIDQNQITINWTNGNGKKKIVFLKQTASQEVASPGISTTYLAATDFGAGTELSPNFHAVYDGYGTSVTVTGLSALTDYRILIYEHNDCVGGQFYNTTVTEGQNATNVQTVGVKRLIYSRPMQINEATQNTSLDLGAESILVPEGVAFNVDGTKLYVVGSSNDNITEFTLSTPFDVTSGTNSHVLDIGGEDGTPRGIHINAAGTRLFLLGSSNDSVYHYQLTTPYDLTTASYSGNAFYIGNEDTNPADLTFDPDGNNMYVSGSNTGQVYQYSLDDQFDLTTANYSGNSLSVVAENGLVFNSDGSALLVGDSFTDQIYQYDLSSNFDITSGVLNDIRLGVGSVDTEMKGFTVNEQSTKFYLIGATNDQVYEYDLPSAAFTESVLDDGTVEGEIRIIVLGDAFVNDGGTLTSGTHYTVTNVPAGLTPVMNVSAGGRIVKLTLTGNATNHADANDVSDLQFTFTGSAFQSGSVSPITNALGYSSNLGINFTEDVKRLDYSVSQDVSGAQFSQSFDLNTDNILAATGIAFSNDGSKMYISGSSADKITSYSLATPFDVTTASKITEMDISLIETTPQGIAINNTGTVMFLVGSSGDAVYEINFSEPFDLSTAFYTGVSFPVESGEATPLDVAISPDGSKYYVGGSNTGLVYEYNMLTAFDLSTASYSGNSLSTLGQDGLVFNANGSRVYVFNAISDQVYQYDLSTPFDITSGTYHGVTFDIVEDGEARGMALNSAGTKMYILGNTADDVFEYDLSAFAYRELPDNKGKVEGQLIIALVGDTFAAPGSLTSGSDYSLTNVPAGLTPDITVATDQRSAVLTLTGTSTNNQNADDVADIQFTFLDAAFTGGSASAIVNSNTSSNLGINFTDNDISLTYAADNNISAATFSQNIDIAGVPIVSGAGLTFSHDGSWMFISGTSSDKVTSFTLSTPYDISTATVSDELDVSLIDGQIVGIDFNRSGTVMIGVGAGNDQIYEWNLTEPFDLGTAAFSGVSLALESGEGTPQDITFSATGARMYVGGGNTGLIYEYDLTTNYDLSTASYSGRSLSTLGTDGVKLNASGTKIFVVNAVQDRIYQYELATPFDVSTGVYNNVTFSTTAQDGEPRAIALNAQGTKLYMIGVTSDDLFEYNLPSATFHESASNDGTVEGTLIVSLNDDTFINAGTTLTETTHYTVDNLPAGFTPTLSVANDGAYAELTLTGSATANEDADDLADLKFTFEDAAFTTNTASMVANSVGGSSNLGINYNDNLLQLTYSTQVDVASATFVDSYELGNISSVSATGMAFGDGGNKLFVVDNSTDRVYELALSTPYDISTATATTDISIINEESNSTDIAFNEAGSRMFLIGTNRDQVLEFGLTTAFDLTTAAFTGTALDLESGVNNPTSMTFAPAGLKLYVGDASTADLYEYDLSTPYDLSTAAYSGTAISAIGQDGLAMNADGTRLFVVNSTSDLAYQYDLSTPFDLSTAVNSGVTFLLNGQDGSATDLEFDPTGTKFYMVGVSNDDIFEYDLSSNAFQEAAPNDGTVLGELLITLGGGDTFVNAGSTLTTSTHYTVDNLPAGFTSSLAVNTDGNVATLTLTGSATANQDADDITDLKFTFTDAAFTNSTASAVSQAIGGSSNLRINFDDNIVRAIYASKVDLALPSANDAFDLTTLSSNSADGMAFSQDGGKLFVIDGTADLVYELSLSTPYDVSTASSVSSLNIINEENNATDIIFNNSGSRMFIVGTQQDEVREYALTTAFDLTTAAYTGNSLELQAAMGSPVSMTFGAGGTKLYVGGISTARIHEYDLSTPYDITTGSFTGNELNTTGYDGVTFNGDGTRIFTINSSSDLVYQYNLSTPWDLSTGTNSGVTLNIAAQDGNAADIELDETGTKLYVLGSDNDNIDELQLSTDVFAENAANDGSVDGELIIVLRGGDQFTNTSSSLTFSTDYTVDVPTGLTSDIAVNADGYAAVLSYSGNAASHQVADDVANILFTFNNSAFAGGDASAVSNVASAASGYAIAFMDNTTVSSITLADTDPTNAATVSWDVVFSAAVTGLTADNFTLVESGLSGSTFNSVGDLGGTNWVVTANVG